MNPAKGYGSASRIADASENRGQGPEPEAQRCGPAPVTKGTAVSSTAESLSLTEDDPVASDGFLCVRVAAAAIYFPSSLPPSLIIHPPIHKHFLTTCFWTTSGLVRKADNRGVSEQPCDPAWRREHSGSGGGPRGRWSERSQQLWEEGVQAEGPAREDLEAGWSLACSRTEALLWLEHEEGEQETACNPQRRGLPEPEGRLGCPP